MSLLSESIRKLKAERDAAISERDAAISERNRLDKICREMIASMKVAEIEFASELQNLREDRNHWQVLWQSAANEVLALTPATKKHKAPALRGRKS